MLNQTVRQIILRFVNKNMNEEVEAKEEKPVWPLLDSNTMPMTPQHHTMPMPTTPQGAPVNQGLEFELPLELQQQGWRRFWSKRENRPYFWNKLTGESLWEMPLLKPHYDPITGTYKPNKTQFYNKR